MNLSRDRLLYLWAEGPVSANVSGLTDAEFDAIAREQGYIKLEDLDVVPAAQERRRLRTLYGRINTA